MQEQLRRAALEHRQAVLVDKLNTQTLWRIVDQQAVLHRFKLRNAVDRRLELILRFLELLLFLLFDHTA